MEKMDPENKINFLDMTIFTDSDKKLEFIKYSKYSVDTVIANFKHSVSKYSTSS